MTIKYDLYEIPVNGEEDEESVKLYPRVLTKGTIDTERLAKRIEESTSMTVGDVLSVLSSLGYLVSDYLAEGYQIYIEGLGYFRISATSPLVSSPKEIRAESIKFKTIKFRPEQSVKKKLARVKFIRSEIKNHSVKLSDEAIEEILTDYFSSHSYITRAEFQNECGFTKTTALKKLNNLIRKKKLKKTGLYSFPIYEPGEEW